MRIILSAALFAGLLIALMPACSSAVPIGPGETVIIDLTGDIGDADDTGIILANKTPKRGDVTVALRRAIAGMPIISDYGYLNSMLRVRVSGLRASEYRLLVKREYARPAAIRSGIRLDRLRAMRNRSGRIWDRAVNAIRRSGIRKIYWRNAAAPSRRDLALGREKGALGNYGHDPSNTYVWAVVDVDGDYAVGGPIPEPLSATVLALGSASLFLIRRRSGAR